MPNRDFGSPFMGFELSVAGREKSTLGVPLQDITAGQAYIDRKPFFATGDTLRMISRGNGDGDTTLTAA